MRYLSILLFAFLAISVAVSPGPAGAAPVEKRLALVIGNAAYKARNLRTSVNDAGLIAQTLQAAGFDVVGARDLDEDLLRQAFHDFVDSAARAGPDAVAVVYFAGYGLQFEGENYLVPVDADISETSDVPLRALRVSEQMHALAQLHLKTTFVILDAARAGPFVLSGQPPAGGLAWVEPEANMLVAFNAAPGTVSPDDGDGYGPYARALAEMIRQGGLGPANLFDRVRLRVNELTKGAQVPWDASKADMQFVFFERGPGAPPRADQSEHAAWMRSQPMGRLDAGDAYMVALLRDTLDAYADFLADYRHAPMTKRVRALLAARREAITWQQTYRADMPEAYWSYSRRYPRGPHMADARRLLTRLGAATTPPAKFAVMEYDVPPPLPDELQYIERTVLAFDDPALAFEPPPPPPAHLLQPPPPEFLAIRPPATLLRPHFRPVPAYVALPAYIALPAGVTAPPNPGNASETPVDNAPKDVPAKGDGQAGSSSISSTDAANNRSPPPAVNSVAPKEIDAPVGPVLPTASAVPLAPADNRPAAAPNTGPPALTTGDEAPTPAPTTSALPPAGMPQTRRAGGPSPQIPLPIPRPVALSRAPGGTPLRPRGTAPPTTVSVPLPAARLATPTPTPTGNRPKPIPPVSSTASPAAVDQTKQPATPVRTRLTPPAPPVRDPKAAGADGVSPPRSVGNP